MAVLRMDGPYIWVTWLTKLLVGENSCEWSAWFKARHEGWSWEKQPKVFDSFGWQMDHSAQVAINRAKWQRRGFVVFTEEQNSFVLRGRTAKLAGKPDLIAREGDGGFVVDVKIGRPLPSHSVQMILYLYAIPKALGQHKNVSFDGKIVYEDHVIDIPATAVDRKFIENASDAIRRLAGDHPPCRVPSLRECQFCAITSQDCSERIEGESVMEGVTGDF